MSRRQQIQDATGVTLHKPPLGVLQIYQTTTPTNGQAGYAPGCLWINLGATSSNGQGFEFLNVGTATSSTWICTDSSSSSQGQFGSATGTYFQAGGNIFRDVSSAGKSPSATAADKIVAAFTLPANAFDATGRLLSFSVWGSFGATGNNKRVKVYFGASNSAPAVDGTVTVTGGTAIVDTGVLTTNGGGFFLMGQLMKYGAANSNTQQSMTTSIAAGGAHAGCGSPTNQTFTENAANLVVVTLNCTTATTDLVYSGCEIAAYN